jgi:predicted porin
MKKTVLAAAALTLATGAAFAQSSLQLYGLVDLSIENVKVDGTSGLTRVSSSNLATSRLGFKGTEDLGGGLKASFVLESAVGADTGAAGTATGATPTQALADESTTTSRFFDRSAWLGLSGGFGAVRIGRMDSLMGAMTGNSSVLGNQAYDDLKIAGMVGSATWRRIDNAVAYALPEMVPGLKAEVQYSLASGKDRQTEAAGLDTDKQYGLAVSYTSGPLGMGVSLLRNKSDVAASTTTIKEGGTLGYASYDFGSFKLIGYYQADQKEATEKNKLIGIRVNVPVTADLLVTASYAAVKNASAGYVATANDDAKILALKAIYSLSKRTAVYALITDVSNDANAKLVVGGTGMNGKDARGIAMGVRHSF